MQEQKSAPKQNIKKSLERAASKQARVQKA
jgi:hypothetical protein